MRCGIVKTDFSSQNTEEIIGENGGFTQLFTLKNRPHQKRGELCNPFLWLIRTVATELAP